MSAIDPRSVTIVVIAKTPVPGRVKTRLCPPCTPEEAAAIASAALADTFDAVTAVGVERCVVALDGAPGEWIPGSFDVVPQRGDGLDERLAAVISDVAGPVLVIGMDTPQLTPAGLGRAVRELSADGVDAVLGPADDGGYWTIGLRSSRPDALVGVPMSTDRTCVEQRRRLDDLRLRTVLLDPMCDVDTFDEAIEVARQVPASRFARAVASVAPPEAAASGGERRRG